MQMRFMTDPLPSGSDGDGAGIGFAGTAHQQPEREADLGDRDDQKQRDLHCLQQRGVILDDRIGDADPSVARAVPDFAPIAFQVWIVAHRDIARSRRLRVVFDALVEGFGS